MTTLLTRLLQYIAVFTEAHIHALWQMAHLGAESYDTGDGASYNGFLTRMRSLETRTGPTRFRRPENLEHGAAHIDT